jgi:2OG-Fe(II) oxygenase superfamily
MQNTVSPIMTISEKDVAQPQIFREKLKAAGPMGFFYLEMPEDCKAIFAEAIQFANTFYCNPILRELKLDNYSGFYVRNQVQAESLYLEEKYWGDYLSKDVAEVATKMHHIATFLLKEILEICQIPQEQWNLSTGGLTENKGWIHFSFNHYRPQEQMEGLNPHRDFNQITILFINQSGLQARIQEKWVDVPPLEGHFIVNFGRTLEMLVNNPQQLTAAWHRVQQVSQDRTSFGIFADNALDSDVYQRVDERLIKVDSYREFVKRCFEETYRE